MALTIETPNCRDYSSIASDCAGQIVNSSPSTARTLAKKLVFKALGAKRATQTVPIHGSGTAGHPRLKNLAASELQTQSVIERSIQAHKGNLALALGSVAILVESQPGNVGECRFVRAGDREVS